MARLVLKFGGTSVGDIDRIKGETSSHFRPARDENFRLLCGVALSAKRTSDGDLEKDELVAHIGAMVEEHLDLVAVSTAHGHTEGVGETIRFVREQFPNLTILTVNLLHFCQIVRILIVITCFSNTAECYFIFN